MEKISLYKVLYHKLREAIIKGEFNVGDLLPSENELCQQHQLTRPTVRQALAQLVNEGYVRKQQGKGSIVQQLNKGLKLLSVEGTTAAFEGEKFYSKILLAPAVIPWPLDFFYPINALEFSTDCIMFERLRSIENRNVIFEKTFITNENMKRFTQKNLENKSLFEMLQKNYQIQITGGEQKIRAIKAHKHVAQVLEVSVGKSLLMLQRKMYTNRKNFFVYSLIFCDTEHYYIQDLF